MGNASRTANGSNSVPVMDQYNQGGAGQLLLSTVSPAIAAAFQAYKDSKQPEIANEQREVPNKCATTLVIVPSVLLNFFALYLLVIGSVYFHQCSVDFRIPLFMIVEATFSIITTGAFWYYRWLNKAHNLASPTIQSLANHVYLNLITELFSFIWLICGSVWIIGSDPNFGDPASSAYCNKVLYSSAYVYIILKWIVFTFTVLITCCITCCCFIALCRNNGER